MKRQVTGIAVDRINKADLMSAIRTAEGAGLGDKMFVADLKEILAAVVKHENANTVCDFNVAGVPHLSDHF